EAALALLVVRFRLGNTAYAQAACPWRVHQDEITVDEQHKYALLRLNAESGAKIRLKAKPEYVGHQHLHQTKYKCAHSVNLIGQQHRRGHADRHQWQPKYRESLYWQTSGHGRPPTN